jgi:hypothetical protein
LSKAASVRTTLPEVEVSAQSVDEDEGEAELTAGGGSTPPPSTAGGFCKAWCNLMNINTCSGGCGILTIGSPKWKACVAAESECNTKVHNARQKCYEDC